MAVYYSASRTANFRNCRGLDGTRGAYVALVMEVQLGTLRGELDVTSESKSRMFALWFCGTSGSPS